MINKTIDHSREKIQNKQTAFFLQCPYPLYPNSINVQFENSIKISIIKKEIGTPSV